MSEIKLTTLSQPADSNSSLRAETEKLKTEVLF